MSTIDAVSPRVVSRAEWLQLRKALLAREKEHTRLGDQLSAEKRHLPWVKVEEDYVFDGSTGKETLASLFGNKTQLLVYHFMFGPDWEQGCPTCSIVADNIDPNVIHLEHRDVTLAVVSRAPVAKIEAFKKRMGGISNGFRRWQTILTTTTASRLPLRKRPKASSIILEPTTSPAKKREVSAFSPRIVPARFSIPIRRTPGVRNF
jgi:predicted dithiol-disulfide oxidoreductase (DUF899 family)